MSFTQSLAQTLSDKHLLQHPFYQAWTEGSIPLETLRTYAAQYFQHVSAFPRYLSATHSDCSNLQARQLLLENLNDEESGAENHPELWLRFLEGLGGQRSDALQCAHVLPQTQALVNTFISRAKSSYAEGLGVLFAYERQVPEVAAFKIDALKAKYGIDDKQTLSFFEVHRQADVYHTQAISELLEQLSPEEKILASAAARDAACALWSFLDGIHGECPERAATSPAQA